MHNILALDGGGIRGVFSLQILARMENLLRKHFNRPDMVLADYFDFIGGTSTGAIIGAALSWGVSVEKIIEFYREQSKRAFSEKTTFIRRLWSLYDADSLTKILRDFFSEDGKGEKPALLGTAKLRTLYLCVMRNATTGSAWVITNSKNAKYANPANEDNNLNIPLYQLIRASAAAPIYFLPEAITAGGQKWLFMDGAITPYNNPAFLMYLTAVLPGYGINWPDGVNNLRLISVGTGRFRARLAKAEATDINMMDQVEHSLKGLIDSGAVHQDLACRTVGHCLWGEPIDSEVGDLMEEFGEKTALRKFLYCRYNHEFTADELKSVDPGVQLNLIDNLQAVPFYERFGQAFAEKHVQLQHLV